MRAVLLGTSQITAAGASLGRRPFRVFTGRIFCGSSDLYLLLDEELMTCKGAYSLEMLCSGVLRKVC